MVLQVLNYLLSYILLYIGLLTLYNTHILGFTAQLVIKHLTENHPELNYALGARSLSKLDEIRKKIGVNERIPQFAINDLSHESKELESLIKRSKVVLSMAGPYTLYGFSVSTICARYGVHFVDINGEGPSYYQKLLRNLSYKSNLTGSILIPSTGLDSLPSDIAVYKSVKALRDNGIFSDIDSSHTSFEGKIKGASGGTISSLLTMFDTTAPKDIKEFNDDVWSLSPEASNEMKSHQPQTSLVHYDSYIGKYSVPWLLGPHNIRVVHRSASLLPKLYSKTFNYSETLACPSFLSALIRGLFMVIGGFLFATFPSFRSFIKSKAPISGTGPSQEQENQSYLELTNTTKTVDGKVVHTKIKAKGHPGYSLTSIMCSEVALLLAKDKCKLNGGIYTPSAALGDDLINELKKYGGFNVETKLD